MFFLGCILLAVGLIPYVYGLSVMGTGQAEMASDLGNGIMLTACVFLLLNLTWQTMRKTQDRQMEE